MYSFKRVFSGVVAVGTFGSGDLLGTGSAADSPSIVWPTSPAVASAIKIQKVKETGGNENLIKAMSPEELEEAKLEAKVLIDMVHDKDRKAVHADDLNEKKLEHGLKQLYLAGEIQFITTSTQSQGYSESSESESDEPALESEFTETADHWVEWSWYFPRVAQKSDRHETAGAYCWELKKDVVDPSTSKPVTCPISMEDLKKGDDVCLPFTGHLLSKSSLMELVKSSGNGEVKCPMTRKDLRPSSRWQKLEKQDHARWEELEELQQRANQKHAKKEALQQRKTARQQRKIALQQRKIALQRQKIALKLKEKAAATKRRWKQIICVFLVIAILLIGCLCFYFWREEIATTSSDAMPHVVAGFKSWLWLFIIIAIICCIGLVFWGIGKALTTDWEI